MSEVPNDFIYTKTWDLISIPENFIINENYTIDDFYADLIDIAIRDHAQYPTAVFYDLRSNE